MLKNLKPSRKPIYLDHAATTQLDPAVFKAMEPYLKGEYGNPSSLYRGGLNALKALTDSRRAIAETLQAQPKEIYFTAGGTESVNLAIFGVARQYEMTNKKKGHIISTTVEHHAVLHSLGALKEEGWEVTLVKVDKDGLVKLDDLKKAVRKNTVLVSVMYANNEIGTIQPIPEIGKWVAGLNKARLAKKLPRVYFHSDACQAGNSLDLNVNKLQVDLLSLNGSKLYGPKQTGALYAKSGTPLRPIIFGGGQERGLRSGIENVGGAVGLAKALVTAQKARTKENARVKKLRDYLLGKILKAIPGTVLNGPDDRAVKLDAKQWNQGLRRLPNNINISIQGMEGEVLMFYLDSCNISVSTGSACSSSSPDPSHVILGLGKPEEAAFSSLRLTLGRSTTKADLDYAFKALAGIVKEFRKTGYKPEKGAKIKL